MSCFICCLLLIAHAGGWTSKQIKASHRLEDLQSRQVNIVHVLRPEAAVQGVPAAQLLSKQQGRQVGCWYSSWGADWDGVLAALGNCSRAPAHGHTMPAAADACKHVLKNML